MDGPSLQLVLFSRRHLSEFMTLNPLHQQLRIFVNSFLKKTAAIYASPAAGS
jgi:hypothetical protein